MAFAADRDCHRIQAILRVAGAAFGSQIIDQIAHQRHASPVTLKPAFLSDCKQAGLGQRLEMEG